MPGRLGKQNMSGSGMSSVGNKQTYEAGDQRNLSQDEINRLKSEGLWNPGNEENHRSDAIHDKRPRGDKKQHQEGDAEHEAELSRRDPTLPAQYHGNEPSKGAKIDAELQAEDLEELRRKGKA
ncbi:hypothetical protein F5884DRAFT_858387 [Xylogone sp. PMI_703]|nr:hypothetical protein F5884DRAFT_858387 [Xylogone sp. PMI_703]